MKLKQQNFEKKFPLLTDIKSNNKLITARFKSRENSEFKILMTPMC